MELTQADIDRFWAKAARTEECWEWTAAKMHKGYGVFGITRNGSKRTFRAHRLAYELSNGPLEAAEHVDHTCHNRACINPSHLRPVSNKQNQENRSGARRDSATGVRGVTFDAERKKYSAEVRHNGRKYFVGRFDTAEDANAAVTAKRIELFTHNDVDRNGQTIIDGQLLAA